MKRIDEIRYELIQIQAKEAFKVYRLARRAKQHGCTDRLVEKIRDEGTRLCRMNPEDLLYPFHDWKYAFKF